MVYAGFWKRFIAFIIDCLILIIPNLAFHWVAPNVGALFIQLLYFPVFECSPLQATPGKYLLGFKVVNENGERLTFSRALARFLLKFASSALLLLGYLIQPFTAKRQTLHDILTKAVVIEHSFSAPVDWFDLWWSQIRYILRMEDKLPADRPDSYKGSPIADNQGAAPSATAAPANYSGVSSSFSAAQRDEIVSAIEKLHELYKNGVLTEDEFQGKKAELLKKL